MATDEYLSDPAVLRRRQLQSKLEGILGTKNVYFQPPPNILMKYPCFVYERYTPYTDNADDKPYRIVAHYGLTYIDSNVERSIAMVNKVLCSFDHISPERSYISDNMNHEIFNLYF